MKLPESRDFALSFEWTEPTGYGLGQAGWVSVRLPVRDDVPIDLLEEWIDESYRAVGAEDACAQARCLEVAEDTAVKCCAGRRPLAVVPMDLADGSADE